jgi:CubicO group peptidase (beta-lactamase class C family)
MVPAPTWPAYIQSPVLPDAGFGWWRILDNSGQHVGIRADGYFGQSLVVLHQHKRVAVRQMNWYPEAERRDTFLDFHQWVVGLVQQVGEDLPSRPRHKTEAIRFSEDRASIPCRTFRVALVRRGNLPSSRASNAHLVCPSRPGPPRGLF